MTIKTTPFDAANFLTSEKLIAEYLAAIREENDPELLQKALEDVARAREVNAEVPQPRK